MTNIGLIGCGGVANGHIRVYENLKNAKVVAVSDIDARKAQNFATRNGINRFFSDYRDLLEIRDLDFVDICTPTSTHFEIVCDAAKSGHNILVEKPMALTTVECDEMINRARKAGAKLCVCHNQIFYSSIRQAKSMIDSGYYDLVSFRTSQKGNPKLYGAPQWNVAPGERGVLWEVGCHLAYLQLHFLKEISEVYAVGGKTKYQVYDNFRALLRTRDQPCGLIDVSWISKVPEIVYEIESADGKRATIDRNSDTLTEKSENSNGGLSSYIRSVLNRFAPSPKTTKSEMRYFIGHYYLIAKYIKSLENETSPPVEPEAGRAAIRLLECIEESLNKHKSVAIK